MWKIVTIVCALWALAESKSLLYPNTTITSICDLGNNINKIQCYCKSNTETQQIKTAECSLTIYIGMNDSGWNEFSWIKNITKLSLTNTKGISLKYIPTKALEHTKAVTKFTIKFGDIEEIPAFAFANLTRLEEIIMRKNQIKTIEKYAFAHHPAVISISLDENEIEEINRDVFVDLPSLEKLYLTSNKITTIHDKAFMHLNNLRELEIDRNHIFSLNSETFHGLEKLARLSLSSNSLEVIGANTFIHLVELRSLALDGNQIQMLDEKAFNGLAKLSSLSLARNKLVIIDNTKTFEGLDSLRSLILRDNQITTIKANVMAPIINNMYGVSSYLDYEGNKFFCDCHLDWFIELMNKTQSTMLKNTIENLKCYPSDSIRESWKKVQESEPSQPQEEEPQNDYEYYDDTQLNGTLFYTDIRFLLNCSESPASHIVFKAFHSPQLMPVSTTTTSIMKTQNLNHGVLELDTVTTEVLKEDTDSSRNFNKVTERNEKKLNPTTSRLATVSAKPIDKTYDEQNMASDEAKPAKPEKINSRRSYQEEIKPEEKTKHTNNSQRHAGCVTLTSIIIMLSLRSFL